LNNKKLTRNSISHRELNAFLIKAKKDIYSNDSTKNTNTEEIQEFNELVKNWTKTSQKILLIMNKKEKNFTDNVDPKSLMAFGAMGAHINMALQALKATKSDH
tara:strand:+ start:754 stop:1062 length:309 start_codon:yes stop_codon:yes gene_type:complete